MLVDCTIILLVSLVSAFFAEALSWLLIYRTEEYQKLRTTIEKLERKVEKKKQETIPFMGVGNGIGNSSSITASQATKIKDKKVDRFEESLKNANRDMAMVKMKSTFVVGFALLSLIGVLQYNFDGKVVAKLPFEPISILTGISHRGLSGNDFTECSAIFFYILCSLSIRANIQKLLGTSSNISMTSSSHAIYPFLSASLPVHVPISPRLDY